MRDTAVEKIVYSVCDDLMQHWGEVPMLVGVIDDQPLSVDEYDHPPVPTREGWGQAELPFAFVYELEEEPELGGTQCWNQTLHGQIQLMFRYERGARERGLAPLGRRYRGEIKRALMKDQARAGNAFRTVFGRNFTDVTPIDGIGAAVVDFEGRYFHNLTDPTSRGIDTAN